MFAIYDFVRTHGVAIDPGPTIGGFWTIWRWEYDFNGEKVIARMEDEGYTTRLIYKTIEVEQSGTNPMRFIKGNLEEFEELKALVK